MSGAQDAAKALQAAVAAALKSVAVAVGGARVAQASMADAEDLVEVMQAAAAVVLACEAVHEAAKKAEADARKALAAAMANGATTFHTEQHTVSLREGARRVIVTDQAELPARFIVQPPRPPEPQPCPDLSAIAFELRNGREVTGATLSNGGPATVVIRNRT